jgi:hypothetical protein
MKTPHFNTRALPAGLCTIIILTLLSSVNAQQMDSTWFRPRQLINLPMPAIKGTTIKGEHIDESFFKENVVLLAFGNLVNVASLKEIGYLNALQQDFQGQPFKILSVIPNAKQDVVDFNDTAVINGDGSHLRASFHLPVMQYHVLATCDKRNPDNTLHAACDNVVSDYLIGGYPVICLIDKQGIIRYIHVGLAPTEEQPKWYSLISSQIDRLLKAP